MKEDIKHIKLTRLTKSQRLTEPNTGQKISSETKNFRLSLILKIMNKELTIIKNKKKGSTVFNFGNRFILMFKIKIRGRFVCVKIKIYFLHI
jgi:hypothetical protein